MKDLLNLFIPSPIYSRIHLEPSDMDASVLSDAIDVRSMEIAQNAIQLVRSQNAERSADNVVLTGTLEHFAASRIFLRPRYLTHGHLAVASLSSPVSVSAIPPNEGKDFKNHLSFKYLHHFESPFETSAYHCMIDRLIERCSAFR